MFKKHCKNVYKPSFQKARFMYIWDLKIMSCRDNENLPQAWQLVNQAAAGPARERMRRKH